jgi:F0F1-type ATP synthase assembly protein I
LRLQVAGFFSNLLGHNVTFAMARKDRNFLARSARRLQENAQRAGPAAGASYTLIGAILVIGGLGYAVDVWRGSSPWFLVGGLFLGVVVGMWELARTVFRR